MPLLRVGRLCYTIRTHFQLERPVDPHSCLLLAQDKTVDLPLPILIRRPGPYLGRVVALTGGSEIVYTRGMPKPKSVKVGAHTCKVEYVAGLYNQDTSQKANGFASLQQRLVELEDNLAGSGVAETFLHEIMQPPHPVKSKWG